MGRRGWGGLGEGSGVLAVPSPHPPHSCLPTQIDAPPPPHVPLQAPIPTQPVGPPVSPYHAPQTGSGLSAMSNMTAKLPGKFGAVGVGRTGLTVMSDMSAMYLLLLMAKLLGKLGLGF